MRNRRHLGDWLSSFQKVFENTEPPEKYVYWVGAVTVGAALQRNVCFDQVTFKLWPNLYVILVGPPAVKKTTAINFGVDRLRKVDGINIGPSSVTWQYLVDILHEIQTPTAEEMARTGQAKKESCPILLPAGELGTLIDFEERAAIDFFTNAWDSPDVYNKGTRLMGEQELNGPCPSLAAGTTPQWIKDNVRGATRGGGFISRCLMPYAERPRRVITYPAKHVKDDHAEQLSYLEHDLSCIATLKGKYELAPDAEALGEQWHKATSAENYGEKISASSDNWANRRYSHVHKLAMVIAASRRDELVIRKEDLQEAIDRVEDLHKDFNKVFALLDERRETKSALDVEEFIRVKRQVLLTDVVVQMRKRFTKKEITDAIEVLLAGGIIQKENKAITGANGGVVSAIILTYNFERAGQ